MKGNGLVFVAVCLLVAAWVVTYRHAAKWLWERAQYRQAVKKRLAIYCLGGGRS